MPEITIDVPVLGNQWAVGLVFQVHLVMVAAIMGGAIVAPAAEIIGVRRRDERYERLAHEISAYTVRFFAFAATWAVVGLVLLVGLYPRLVGVLVSGKREPAEADLANICAGIGHEPGATEVRLLGFYLPFHKDEWVDIIYGEEGRP